MGCPPHVVPYAVIAKVEFAYLRTMRVPEAQIPMLRHFGWSVLIRDSDMSDAGETYRWLDLRSGPQRCDDEPEMTGE